MRRSLKILGYVLISLIALLCVALSAGLGYRVYRQHQNSDALNIRTPNGIEEAMFVEIGGLRQWIQIRGEDKANPVLLFVHGGPAISMIPFTFRSMRAWEKEFTIVQWDQRGAGRTYLENGGADTTATGLSQIIDDGLRVSEYVRARLGKERIILMGESWGSAVAIEMARARPDLFVAFVGTGQAIDMRHAETLTYRLLLEGARASRDDDGVRQLTAIGPPPYATEASSNIEQQVLGRYLARVENQQLMGRDFLFAPGYSLRQCFELIASTTRHRSVLVKDDEAYSALARGAEFGISLFFFEGTDDIQAPAQLVSEYLSQITAPSKELVLFPGGGHNAFFFLSDRFLHELTVRVRPLATSSNTIPREPTGTDNNR
jgi:pimeloyl-ACP methyl ester carboxylesterase